MKLYRNSIILWILCVLPLFAYAIEPDIIPVELPAKNKEAFKIERVDLLAEDKSLKKMTSRYNANCSKPKPYQEHDCTTRRLDILQKTDNHKLKVQDFNHRMDLILHPPKPKMEE